MLHKIYHIAKREFLIRVRKKTFWVMVFVGPIIMALLMIVPLWLTLDKESNQTIVVSGLDHQLFESLPEIEGVNYLENTHLKGSPDSLIKWFGASADLRFENEAFLFSSTQINKDREQLIALGLTNKLLLTSVDNTVLPSFNTNYLQSTSGGRAIQELMAYAMGIGVYFFIFMYGVQVMKGVVEEKTNRIIEVMLCTVKPFELMMGKIFGISLVGLLQFVIWILLILLFESVVTGSLALDQVSQLDLNTLNSGVDVSIIQEAQGYLSVLSEMNLGLILTSYLWFFLFGFLLYAAFFAVIGAASDVDTDTQQFIFPLTVPLFGTIILAQNIVGNPNEFTAQLLSIFPLSSPIAMPMRLPFSHEIDGFIWQLMASAIVLVIFFISIVWVAARIYRVALLSYGSKVGYKQLVKWFFEKE